MPLVSIIVPVYNTEKYLTKCLDSIINQSYSNIEVICVNDGSTDNSLSILKEYEEVDNRISIVDIPNQGVSNARNIGMEHAKGVWIIFVDSDDWLDNQCLDICLDSMYSNMCDIIMFPYISEYDNKSLPRLLFEDNRFFKGEAISKLARRMIGPIDEELTDPTKLDSYGTVWGKVYRKDLLRSELFVDLKRIGTAEDSLFNMFVFKKARTVYYTTKTYYHYRKTNNLSITSRHKPNLREQWHYLYGLISQNFKGREERVALSNRIALNTLGESLNEYSSNKPFTNIKELLRDECFCASLSKLKTHWMPLHWRLFFFCARHKMAFGLICLIYCMKKIK